MRLQKRSNYSLWSLLRVVIVVTSVLRVVQCQDADDNEESNPEILPLITRMLYNRLTNLTTYISREIGNEFKFCVKDPEAEWDKAFNYSSNLDFLSACLSSQADVARRICTSAETKLYFNSFLQQSMFKNYYKSNKNCNLTSWVSGCEPGWACSVDPDDNVDLQNSKTIPQRTLNCKACCQGFFCPHGMTCMIPCPLGSYCPLATLNKTTGVCNPYHYQLPPGMPNHTCGGADIWADVGSSREIFCPAGSFCPTTATKKNCSSGQYCRMGSTSPKRCFKLTSCNNNASSQNIRAYGIMVLAALITLLLILYNCSDQVISMRERRLAKTREAAANSVRKTAKARQKWKSAKMKAIKQLSRTFSRKKSDKADEELKILHDSTSSVDSNVSSSSRPHHIQQRPSSNTEGKKRHPSDLMRVIRDIEADPDDYSGIDVEVAHADMKGYLERGKQKESDSQIFRYAYNQLEKEKAMEEENKGLTFSKVIAMATDGKIKRRPLIEIYFKDLSLTLKANDKYLLRSVTGKIKPGRITAVMGPSGAGKTTFLSALAGKAVGCRMQGLVLINGISVSIRSYKKIIGFVPQDDVVHGDLTVEENLWFSAHCRLPVGLPKSNKVLIVERVIESLGLQAVRDSLVGTVEKRGISGGQRKRVNVGLEMVMEPSLLILDEPTSGLDSASSQQLLRALRRESLEGVNICMVVHQPSYTLFRMFDDLVLLAKGGVVVYLGPVKKVEGYFSGIGINVPERVNPPDHYIDILEGIVPPSSGLSYKELPVRWMLHNGYPIPNDMQKYATGLALPLDEIPARESVLEMKQHSFAGELWLDVKNHVHFHRDKIQLNFLKSIDLSKRKTPGIFSQYKFFLGRVIRQRLRDAKTQAIDYLILLLAGTCLGLLTKSSDQTFGSAGYTYTIIAVSLLCKISALRSFSQDKLQHWRESASGISCLAYFLSKDTVDYFNIVVKPVVYLSMFYFLTNPRSPFADNYSVLVCLVYCVTGIGYALAIFFEPGPAQLWSVLLPVVLTLIATKTTESQTLKVIARLCYPKWALEAFVVANAERYYGVWMITRCGSLLQSGYNLHQWSLCIAILLFIGVLTRAVAFVGMLIFRKN